MEKKKWILIGFIPALLLICLWAGGRRPVLQMDLEEGYQDKVGGFSITCTNQSKGEIRVLPDSIRVEHRNGLRWEEVSIQMDASLLTSKATAFLPGDTRMVYLFQYYSLEDYPQMKNLEDGQYRFCCTVMTGEKEYDRSCRFQIRIKPMTPEKLMEKPSVLQAELYPDWFVTLEVSEVDVERHTYIIRIINGSEKEVRFDIDEIWGLDYQIGQEWYELRREIAVAGGEETITLFPGEEWERKLPALYYEDSQAELLPGVYRAVVEIRVDGQEYLLTEEFMVEPPLKPEDLKEIASEIENIYERNDIRLLVDMDVAERCYTAAVDNQSKKEIEVEMIPLPRLEYQVEDDWYYVDYIYAVGPMSFKETILPGEYYEYTDSQWELRYSSKSKAPLLSGTYRILFPVVIEGEEWYLEYGFEI